LQTTCAEAGKAGRKAEGVAESGSWGGKGGTSLKKGWEVQKGVIMGLTFRVYQQGIAGDIPLYSVGG
jgi:hypothetical protein